MSSSLCPIPTPSQRHLGTLIITNVRIVWYANLSQTFNVSLPYVQVQSVKIRESKLGTALVVDVFPRSGGYILGFRIDPVERLREIADEVHAMHQIYASTPIFGLSQETVLKTVEGIDDTAAETVIGVEDDVDIIDDASHRHDPLSLYCAEGPGHFQDRDIVFDNYLGLAVERIRDSNYTIAQLWQIESKKPA